MHKQKATVSAPSTQALKLVLASGSAKRKEILQGLNLRFTSYSPEVKEITQATSPKELVTKNALLKLQVAKEKFPNHFIITADTVVVSGGKIFFKPKTIAEGNKMLGAYSKNSQSSYTNKNYVITGIAVYSPSTQKTVCRTDSSSFKISLLSSDQLKKIYHRIFSTKQSGGFSIENWGSVLISSITGSYYNILGLPLHTLNSAFYELGTDLEIFLKTKANR